MRPVGCGIESGGLYQNKYHKYRRDEKFKAEASFCRGASENLCFEILKTRRISGVSKSIHQSLFRNFICCPWRVKCMAVAAYGIGPADGNNGLFAFHFYIEIK